MQPVKWGVLSTAKIGVEKVIPAMQQGKLCDIVAIASRDQAKALETADRLGIPKAYGSYEELLADPEIEAIYNPLPNHMHVPWSVKAAVAGKHVLCEKPVSLTAPEAETLVAARDKKGVLITEAFMVRSHPQWLRVRELIRAGKIGRLVTVQGFFSYFKLDPTNIRNMADIGGGGIYDIGCYPIVGARFAFEAEPTRVVSLIDRDLEMKIDRLASGILDFGEGRQATFTCSTQCVPYQRIHFFGTEGRLTIRIPFNAPPDEPCVIFIDDGSGLGDKSEVVEEFPVVDQYMIQGDLFSEHVRTGEPVEFPLENAVANMKILDALFRSAETDAWETV